MQPDMVEMGDAAIERRMVDEDRHRFVACAAKRSVQPGETHLVITPADQAGLMAVEKQQSPVIGVEPGLNEAMVVARMLREGLDEGGARVMIAEQQANLEGHRGKNIAQQRIGFRVAEIAEVAGDDQEVGIGMFDDNVGHRYAQLLFRVDAMDDDARWHQMRVGQVDDFHMVVRKLGLRGRFSPQAIDRE